MFLVYKDKTGIAKRVRLKAISHTKPITIGRGEESDITLDDTASSRVHSAVRYWDDIFIIRDMNSRNGTFVNDERIEVAALHPGDKIRVGDTIIEAISDAGSKADVTEIIRGDEIP